MTQSTWLVGADARASPSIHESADAIQGASGPREGAAILHSTRIIFITPLSPREGQFGGDTPRGQRSYLVVDMSRYYL